MIEQGWCDRRFTSPRARATLLQPMHACTRLRALFAVSFAVCLLLGLGVACGLSISPPPADATPSPLQTPSEEPRPALAAAIEEPAGDDAEEAYDRPQPEIYDTLAGIRYFEKITGEADPAEALPLVVAIHGLGDRPEHFAELLRGFHRPARIILPAGFHKRRDGAFAWFTVRVRSGETTRLAAELAEAADRLAPFLVAIAQERPTIGKPVITGFSQGGMLAFALAIRHPEALAAAYPIGGWLPPPLWPGGEVPLEAGPKTALEKKTEDDPGEEPERNLEGPPETIQAHPRAALAPPIIALHGDADAVVPIGPTRRAVIRLRALGYPVVLREYPAVGHQITREMRQLLWKQLAAATSALRNDAPIALPPAPRRRRRPPPPFLQLDHEAGQ